MRAMYGPAVLLRRSCVPLLPHASPALSHSVIPSLLPADVLWCNRRFTSTTGSTGSDSGDKSTDEASATDANGCAPETQERKGFSGLRPSESPAASASGFSLSSAASAPVTRRRALPPSDFPESALLKCIDKEIEDEALRLDREEAPPQPPAGWEMYHAPGTSVFYGRRWWLPTTPSGAPRAALERHTVRVQLTKRDPSLDPECDFRGEHFPFSLFVQQAKATADAVGLGGAFRMTNSFANDGAEGASEEHEKELNIYDQSMEVRADFVDGKLVFDNVVLHGSFRTDGLHNREVDSSQKAGTEGQGGAVGDGCNGADEGEEYVHYNNMFSGYPGPNLDEADEKVLDGLQTWMAERCVDDQFGEFVGQYSVWVEQQEYERWLKRLRDFVAA